jgi:hypothetical protein
MAKHKGQARLSLNEMKVNDLAGVTEMKLG